MGKYNTKRIGFILGLLVALIILTVPVCAETGTLNIAYRGSGGSYLGETVIFDGYNTFSNVTVLKINGPGLPEAGLPIYDLNGEVGSGNTVPVNPDGTWKIAWYTSSIKGAEKLQTARYTITAYDLTYPEHNYTTSLLLKKPEFFMTVSPNTASLGDYIQLAGSSEKGSSSVQFDIADDTGKIVHNYESTVSSSGYFNKGFHVDMPPGIYTITMSSPSVKTTYRNYLTVNGKSSVSPGQTITIEPPTGTVPSVTGTTGTVPGAAGTGALSISSSPAGTTVFLDSVLVGTTPLELNAIPVGNHIIDIKAPGYTTNSVQVLVKQGETMTISPILIKNPSSVPVSLFSIIVGVVISLAVIIACVKRR